MGLGHVPTGPVPRARQGADLPRRERRRVGAARDLALTDRGQLGEIGERIAAGFLVDHGLDIVARNLDVGRGEIDLLAVDGRARVVIEVRAITGNGDPIDAVDYSKRRHVRSLAGKIGATRVDFVGVGIRHDDVVIHWVPGCG